MRAADARGLVQGLCEPAACGGRGDRDPKTPQHAYPWDSKLCPRQDKQPQYKDNSVNPVNKQTKCQYYHNRRPDDNGDDICVPCGFPGHKCDDECEFTVQWNANGSPRHNMGTYRLRFDLRVCPYLLFFAFAAALGVILQAVCVNCQQLQALQGLLQRSVIYTLHHCARLQPPWSRLSHPPAALVVTHRSCKLSTSTLTISYDKLWSCCRATSAARLSLPKCTPATAMLMTALRPRQASRWATLSTPTQTASSTSTHRRLCRIPAPTIPPLELPRTLTRASTMLTSAMSTQMSVHRGAHLCQRTASAAGRTMMGPHAALATRRASRCGCVRCAGPCLNTYMVSVLDARATSAAWHWLRESSAGEHAGDDVLLAFACLSRLPHSTSCFAGADTRMSCMRSAHVRAVAFRASKVVAWCSSKL